MSIKVVVELRARPGERDELQAAFEQLLAVHAADLPGFLGSSRFGRADDPDVLVEIADWESAEARDAHMAEAVAAGTYGPLFAMLAEPPRIAVLDPLA